MTVLRRFALVLAISATSVGAIAAAAAGDGGGPSPGISFGGAGVTGAGGVLRYVTVLGRTGTVVESIVRRNARVLNWAPIVGLFGIPVVAFDGTAGGLSHDGKTLILSSYPSRPGPGAVSRFVVFDTSRYHVRRTIVLRGTYGFDAVAPDGSTIYLIQYTSSKNWNRYRVRAFDLVRGRLLAGAIVDRREPVEAMSGSPVTRVTSADGVWAYTLYTAPRGANFVHALDTVHRRAFCVDLPWPHLAPGALQGVRLTVAGRRLVLTQPPVGRLAEVDRSSFSVSLLRKPVPDGGVVG